MDRLDVAARPAGPRPAKGREGPASTSILGEFRGRAHIVAGGFLGLVAGMASLVTYTFGVFAAEFGKEYGWSRGDMSLAMSSNAVVLCLGSVFAGRVADAFGAGKVAAASMLAFGVSLVLLPFFVHDVMSLWIAYGVITVAGLGTTPVVMLKPALAAFSDQRGIASGIVLCGSGVGAILTPPIVNALIEGGGWRLGYWGLGYFAVAVSPIIWLTLARRRGPAPNAVAATPRPNLPGLSLQEAGRLREFWLLSAIALFATLGISGMIAHLVPFLRDLDTPAATAAGYASLLGVSTLVGRVGSGVALDRFRGSFVGLMFLGSGVLGVLLLALYGAQFALPAVMLIGLALGAEIDLLAYLISRYFGLRHHGSIFGWTFGMVGLGSIFSPYLAGVLRDQQGGYGLAMTFMIGCLATASALCLLLGRYRYGVK